jgi:hypothetical protein
MDRYLRTSLARNIERWAPPRGTPQRSEFFYPLNTHHSLTLEVLELYPDGPWTPDQLVKNPNFDWKWVDKFPTWGWNWKKLSMCIQNIDTVLRYLDKPWDWGTLTLVSGVTFADMVTYNNLPWDIENLLFQEITDEHDISFLRMYVDRYDELAWIDHSRRATWNVVKRTLDLPWKFDIITPDIKTRNDLVILGTISDRLDWDYLSRTVNANLILSYQTLPWLWSAVSKNPTLTFHHVMAHPNIPWKYTDVPVETLDDTLARKWMAAFKIQHMWRMSISNPLYKICRNRLLEEYHEYNINVAERCDR